jgi:hypothetical protein
LDSFIGEEITTSRGNTLTVISYYIREVDGRKIYRLSCDVCSKDKELFPRLFEGRKGELRKGSIPCGCSKFPFWSEGQNITRIRRLCETKDYIFSGWEGAYNKTKTRVRLTCDKHKFSWSKATINSFMSGSNCPLCGTESSTKCKDDEVMISNFTKGVNRVEGTNFYRCTGKGWYYTCPICSEDKFSKNGLCSGRFYTTPHAVKSGVKSCRCSPRFHWSREQREFQIKELLNICGGNFTNWVKGTKYKNTTDTFAWVCNENHECVTSVDSFITAGSRCSTCGRSKITLYSHRLDEIDTLYIAKLTKGSEVLLKVGRTLEIKRRLGELTEVGHSVEVLDIFTGKHKYIHRLETEIHYTLNSISVLPLDNMCGYTECYDLSDYVVIKNQIEKLYKEYV